MTDIADRADDGEDDVAFALRLIRDPGVAAVPGSSFYSRPELGRSKLRFAFPKRHETLEAASERLSRPPPRPRARPPPPRPPPRRRPARRGADAQSGSTPSPGR